MDQYTGTMGGVFQVWIRTQKQQISTFNSFNLSTQESFALRKYYCGDSDFFVDILLDYQPLPWLALPVPCQAIHPNILQMMPLKFWACDGSSIMCEITGKDLEKLISINMTADYTWAVFIIIILFWIL